MKTGYYLSGKIRKTGRVDYVELVSLKFRGEQSAVQLDLTLNFIRPVVGNG